MDALETTNYAKIAWSLIEKSNGNTQDDFDDASELFEEEVRARYIAEEDGDFETYLKEARAIFETEWNDKANWQEVA